MADDPEEHGWPSACNQEECQECRWQCQAVLLARAGKVWIDDDQYHHRHCANLGQSHPHSTMFALNASVDTHPHNAPSFVEGQQLLPPVW